MLDKWSLEVWFMEGQWGRSQAITVLDHKVERTCLRRLAQLAVDGEAEEGSYLLGVPGFFPTPGQFAGYSSALLRRFPHSSEPGRLLSAPGGGMMCCRPCAEPG